MMPRMDRVRDAMVRRAAARSTATPARRRRARRSAGPRCARSSSATTAGSSASSRGRRSSARSSPPAATRAATRAGEIAEVPLNTLDSELPLDEAFRFLEEHDLERVPVVEDGRLVGVLSRARLQRRLAEDEPPRRATRLAEGS